MWGRVRKALKGLDPVRIENRCEKGTPDVNYVEGWVELKIGYLPKKKDTVLSIEHYTNDQKVWAIRRHHAGGKVFLLLKVSNEWLLFTGVVAAEYLNKSTMETLREVALKVWKKKLIDQELRNLLTSHQENIC